MSVRSWWQGSIINPKNILNTVGGVVGNLINATGTAAQSVLNSQGGANFGTALGNFLGNKGGGGLSSLFGGGGAPDQSTNGFFDYTIKNPNGSLSWNVGKIVFHSLLGLGLIGLVVWLIKRR